MTVTMRMIACTVALLMTVSFLVSCGGDQPSQSSVGEAQDSTTSAEMTTAQSQTGPTKLEGDPIELTSECVLLVGDVSNDAMLILANSLKKKIYAKTGLSLTLGRESTKGAKEIILGYQATCEATVEVYAALGRGEYGVFLDGTVSVLGGWTREDVNAAADLFIDRALVQEDGKWMIYPCAVRMQNSLPTCVDLSLYRIVYPAGAGTFIKETLVTYLQNRLHDTFGISPQAVPDSEAPTEYEIVLGDTNRTTDSIRAQLNQAGTASRLTYALVPEGYRVHLISAYETALFSAAEMLCSCSTPEIGPATFYLLDEPRILSLAGTDDKAELAEGADIRIMSYNILHPLWSNTGTDVPVEGRDVNFTKILMYYMPDVVGIQEVNVDWHRAIQKMLVDTGVYEKACKMKRNGLDYNLTTFLYNPRTVKLIDEYVIDLDANSNIRVFSVAVFETLSDGVRFVVTNTHPAPTGQAANYQRNFADMTRIAKAELAKYEGLPFMMTGDFNTKEQLETYQTFQDAVGVKDAKYKADVLVRNYSTFLKPAWNGVVQKGNAACIDHIFVNDKADVKLFNVVIDHDVEKTSDHIPIYADIDLK